MNKIIAIVAIIAALLGAHYWSQGVAVGKAVELTTSRLNKEWQSKMDVSLKKKDEAQNAMSISHYKELENKDAKLKDVNRKLVIANNSLQSRPPRNSPSPVTPSGATISQTCTGSQLPREDAEFLTGEAATAAGIVIERDYYYQEYENVRIILEQLRK